MDFTEKADNLIAQINNFDGSREKHAQLINAACDVFDLALKEILTNQQISFLFYLSSLVGVPQYFDLLCKLKKTNYAVQFSNSLFFAGLVRESNLVIDTNIKAHFFQKQVIDKFDLADRNRFIVSAPTSFGKTFIIYHIIEKMLYKNVVLLFPTISLLSENLQRLMELIENKHLGEYKLITLSEEKPSTEKNIFIFTPERFMTFIDKNPSSRFDYIFMDEIYKIDNEFISNDDNQEEVESNRDIAFRIALEMSIVRTKDCLLAGPFLTYGEQGTMKNFIRDNGFLVLSYNDIDLVQKRKATYSQLKNTIFDSLSFANVKKSSSNTDKIVKILEQIKGEETIIYCQTKHSVEEYALKIAERKIFDIDIVERFEKLIKHLERNFTPEWCVIKALKAGIGIHHGTIPKYIQREIIKLFNLGIIKCIFSTTTITEGVNTTAKNMVILSHKKGTKVLKKFDVLNIIGRAGRFNQHFSGRIFIIDEEVENILHLNSDNLEHKNYGIETRKSDLDLAITKEKYMNANDKSMHDKIQSEYDKYEVPISIRESFLTISHTEKIKMFELIHNSLEQHQDYLPALIKQSSTRRINLQNLDLLIDLITKVISEDDKLLKYTFKGNNEYALITYWLNSYLIGGYPNLLHYELDLPNPNIDKAIRKVSNIVYNLFRYELVKHIGLIDLIYKTIFSQIHNVKFDEVNGFSALLSYLEYGAYTEIGRKVSDFGVTYNILRHIENSKIEIDDYERILLSEVTQILK